MAWREGEGGGTCISVNVFIVLIPIRIIYFREILSIRISNLVPFFSFRFSRDFIRDPIIVKEFLYVGERICASGNFFRGELNEKILILKFEKVGDDK